MGYLFLTVTSLNRCQASDKTQFGDSNAVPTTINYYGCFETQVEVHIRVLMWLSIALPLPCFEMVLKYL